MRLVFVIRQMCHIGFLKLKSAYVKYFSTVRGHCEDEIAEGHRTSPAVVYGT